MSERTKRKIVIHQLLCAPAPEIVSGLGNQAVRSGIDGGKLLFGILVDLADTGAGQRIMELIEQKRLPGLGERLRVVGHAAEHGGGLAAIRLRPAPARRFGCSF